MTDAPAPFDVVGLGNAIVDVVVRTDDAALAELGLAKGATTLIGADKASELRRYMEGGLQVSGGSAANTIAGLASLGGRGAFLGKVGGDALGRVFRDDIAAVGVEYRSPPAAEGSGPAAAWCSSPDAERTDGDLTRRSTAFGPTTWTPG